jgi:hypothetical protein
MNSRGGAAGPRHRRGGAALLLLAAGVRLYGALLVLYSKAFRRGYSEEMRRDFRELMREGLQGGATGLVRVWAQAFWDLVLTALKERSTLLSARSAYSLFLEPRMAARAVLVAQGQSVANADLRSFRPGVRGSRARRSADEPG